MIYHIIGEHIYHRTTETVKVEKLNSMKQVVYKYNIWYYSVLSMLA